MLQHANPTELVVDLCGAGPGLRLAAAGSLLIAAGRVVARVRSREQRPGH